MLIDPIFYSCFILPIQPLTNEQMSISGRQETVLLLYIYFFLIKKQAQKHCYKTLDIGKRERERGISTDREQEEYLRSRRTKKKDKNNYPPFTVKMVKII